MRNYMILAHILIVNGLTIFVLKDQTNEVMICPVTAFVSVMVLVCAFAWSRCLKNVEE